jgi:hypothetical protein
MRLLGFVRGLSRTLFSQLALEDSMDHAHCSTLPPLLLFILCLCLLSRRCGRRVFWLLLAGSSIILGSTFIIREPAAGTSFHLRFLLLFVIDCGRGGRMDLRMQQAAPAPFILPRGR